MELGDSYPTNTVEVNWLLAEAMQNKSDFTEPRKGLYRDKKKDSILGRERK